MTMRLYVAPFAPNAIRVETFALEKAIELDTIVVPWGDHSELLKANPLGQVPTLQLDDGSIVTESLTICRYLDEIGAPPCLFGSTPEERARIGMWERRAELMLFIPSVEYGHHTSPMFATLMTQHRAWAESIVPKSLQMLEIMADQLLRTPYLAGEVISAADFTAALGYFGLIAWGAILPSEDASIERWSSAMIERPSMAPLREVMRAFKGLAMPDRQDASQASDQ